MDNDGLFFTGLESLKHIYHEYGWDTFCGLTYVRKPREEYPGFNQVLGPREDLPGVSSGLSGKAGDRAWCEDKAVYKYSTVVYVVELVTTPIGVVVWGEGKYALRVGAFKDFQRQALLDLEVKKILKWCKSGGLPYFTATDPTQDEWWNDVRQLLIHSIALTEAEEAPGPWDPEGLLTRVLRTL